MNRVGTLDIEASDLLSNLIDYTSFPYKLKNTAKIWVVSVTDVQTMQTTSLSNEQITKESVDNLIKDYTTLVAHNGHKYDWIVLQLFGLITYRVGYLGETDTVNDREVRLIDSSIMSRFINPDRIGGHSLSAWGKRVNVFKTDYRGELIKLQVIEPNLPKGQEFRFFHPLMVDYCEGDTLTTAHTYLELLKEYKGYSTAKQGLQLEHKLADLAVRRESLGFWFDKDLALKNLEYLNNMMAEIKSKVDPLLPNKKLTQTDLNHYTPPAKQLKADGTWSTHMVNFLERHNITEHSAEQKWFKYKGNLYEVPHIYPLETDTSSSVDDLDVVKHKLIELGWQPSEWKERDLTKDAKKQDIPLEKRRKALQKWFNDTIGGKYKKERLKILGMKESEVFQKLSSQLTNRRGVKVPTSPTIRVGVTKELCPNLIKLGDKVSFAKDVADYYTYRHRRSAIAGGDIQGMDLEDDTPETGYLSQVREEDSRIPTPSIELGASTNRYTHIGVANVPRTTSLFGEEMRAMFGVGGDDIQFGFDYASLEARIQGAYVFDYEGGRTLAFDLLQEKPFDVHSLMADKLGIERTDAKSVNYMFMYGGSASKVEKMLGYPKAKAVQFHKDWWDEMLPLKQLKEDKEREWAASDRKYVLSLDGRRINIRSQHSIINALFQSAGVIFAKYVTVLLCKEMEGHGLCIDVFKGKPQVSSMIEYHDEQQQLVSKELLSFKKFNSKEDAKEFVAGWGGEQLGAIQKGLNGYYVTLPSIVSRSITKVIKQVEEMFSMKVEMGYEYVSGRNWKDCH